MLFEICSTRGDDTNSEASKCNYPSEQTKTKRNENEKK